MAISAHFVCLILVIYLGLSSLVRADDTDYFARWFNDEVQEIYDTEETLPVKGTLPKYLVGNLIRLGPTLLHTPNRNYTNFVDAFGRIGKWRLDGGSNTATLQSCIIKSSQWNASNDGNDIPSHITSQKTEPESKGVPNLAVMDNTDVYVHQFPGSDEYITFTDFHLGNRIHVSSLRTLGNTVYNDNAKGTYSGSHYGQYFDVERNEEVLVNWLGEPAAGGIKLSVYKMGSDFVRHVVGTLKVNFTPFSIHAITIAGKYAFVTLGPVEIDFLKTGANKCLSCSAHSHLSDGGKTMIYVFDLEDSDQDIIQIESPTPFFTFHQINGIYDATTHQASLDMCIYTSMDGVLGENVLGNIEDILNVDTRNNMASNCNALWRVNLDLPSAKVTSINELPVYDAQTDNSYRVELVSTNPDYINQPYCYVYGLTNYMNGGAYEDYAVLKINICDSEPNASTVSSSYYQSGIYVGEPLFVPNPDGVDEDDGVVLVVSRDGELDISRLLVLDGKDLSSVLAEIESPFPFMFEFHGKFFPGL